MVVSAQSYSGKVGETINLSDPNPPIGYEKYEAVYKTYSKHLDVYKGTSRVKILSYFTGYETVECVLYCVRQVPGKVPEYYTSKTYYYQISCSSAPEPDPEQDPEPNPDPNYDELYDPTKYYQTKVLDRGPCLGTIDLKVGDTHSFYYDYTSYPKPEYVKSIVWSDYTDWGQDVTWGYQITYQSKSSCSIKAIEPCKERKLWYLMKYGSSTYKLYYIINVTALVPTAITLTSESISIEVGSCKKLSYSLTPSGAASTVKWKSDDSSIATVSASGEIKGIKAGTTNIRATTENGRSSTCTVTVTDSKPKPISGDLNSDGTVNGTDIVLLTNMILGKTNKTSIGDVNGDGEVNGTDIVKLVNIILNK